MKDTIKRQAAPIYARTELTKEVLDKASIFAPWYTEVANENRMFYRFSNRLSSYHSDALTEQRDIISKFHHNDLDITKSYFAITIPLEIQTDKKLYWRSNKSDYLVSDLYFVAKKVSNPQEIAKEHSDELRDLLSEDLFTYITKEDIDNYYERETELTRIIANLDPGEVLLSGEITVPTNRGRLISFGDIESAGITREKTTVIATKSSDSIYMIIDPLAVIETLTFHNPTEDEPVVVNNPEQLFVVRAEPNGLYGNIYDVDGDGYISQEDIALLRSYVGRSVENTSPEDWTANFYKYDRDQDGTISDLDIAPAIKALGSVYVSSLVIYNPLGRRTCEVEFEYFEDPYTTYYSDKEEVSGGSFGIPTELESGALDVRVADGFAESTVDVIIGINIGFNQVWAGRRTEIGLSLQKINYPDSDRMLVAGMTFVDDVAFILLRAEDDFKYQGITNIAILRVDTKREVIEVSRDMLPVLDIIIEDNEILTGISSTLRKDEFRIFTSTGKVHKVKMLLNVAVATEDGNIYASQGMENYIPEEEQLGRNRIYNDIDGFAFTYGIERAFKYGTTDLETNEELHTRIKNWFHNPPGNDIIGKHIGLATEIGSFVPTLYKTPEVTLWNAPVPGDIIELEFKIGNRDFAYTYDEAQEITDVFKRKAFLGESIIDLVPEELVLVYHRYENDIIVSNKTVQILPALLKEVMINYVKAWPEKVLKVPNNNENLVTAENVQLTITYNNVDPDGVIHNDIKETHTINIASIDQLNSYLNNFESMIGPISPDTELYKECVTFYQLADKHILNYIGEEKYQSIIAELRKLDISSWDKTVIDTSFFDDKYASLFIIKPTEFDSSDFKSNQIEIDV